MGSVATGEEWSQKEPAGQRMIKLTSSEGNEFCVTEEEALLSPYLAGLIGNNGGDVNNVIALSNVPGRALGTVIEYFKKHAAVAATADAYIPSPRAVADISSFDDAAPPNVIGNELYEWDRELVRGLGNDFYALCELLMAARFLRLDALFDAGCENVADMIKDWSPREIRENFQLPDDLTTAEKEKIRKEFAWAFRPGDDV